MPACGCCHYIFGVLGRRRVAAASVCGVFADVVGQRDAGGLEDIADLAGDVGPRGDDLAALLDGCLLEPVEIVQQLLPFGLEAPGPTSTVEPGTIR